MSDYLSKESRDVVNQHIGKLELRGEQVWLCYESVPWGLKWRPIIDLTPLVRMMREGLNVTALPGGAEPERT